jgi:cytochrome P450
MYQVTIGINPWVAHRNRPVFGNDADLFVPERWIEGKESSSGREAYFLSVSDFQKKMQMESKC